MAAHRYWRLFCVDNNGDVGYCVVGELEFRATPGGADQTNPTTALTAATASSNAGSGAEPYRAFDNAFNGSGSFDGTYWATSGTAGSQLNCWVAYDFGSAVSVQQIAVSCSRDTGRAPKNMRVEYSDDGSTWSTEWTISTPQTAWTLGETRVFTTTVVAAATRRRPVYVST